MKAASAGNKINCSEGVHQQQLPMAMFAIERNSNKRLLFDVSSRKIHGVSSHLFADATCAFENRGWLLMIRRHRPRHFQEQSAFLVHASSGKQLHLPVFRPCPEDEGHEGRFVFYVGSHGTPLVVARFAIWSDVPTVHVACPGDTYWSVYKHGGGAELEPPHMSRTMRSWSSPERTWIADLALVGTQAVCVDIISGQILVFDITEMTWGRRRITAPPCPGWSQKNRRRYFLVASSHGEEEEVVLVSRRPGRTMENAFEFFRLDMEAMEWSQLDGRELDDTGWFLCRGQSFCVKDAGRRRVYTFGAPKPMDSCEHTTDGMATGSTTRFIRRSASGHDEGLKSSTDVYAYDLDDGTVEMVIPASLVTEVCQWVQPSIFATTAK